MANATFSVETIDRGTGEVSGTVEVKAATLEAAKAAVASTGEMVGSARLIAMKAAPEDKPGPGWGLVTFAALLVWPIVLIVGLVATAVGHRRLASDCYVGCAMAIVVLAVVFALIGPIADLVYGPM
jgi:hypothetical protein